MLCWSACGRERWLDETPRFAELPPRCPSCGGIARPGVVWFGEGIDVDTMAVSARAAEECDVFLVVGTASVVYPAAGLVDLARAAGVCTVAVNPQTTGASAHVDAVLPMRAQVALPLLDARLRGG